LADADVDRLVVVGPGPRTGAWDDAAGASLAPWGVPLEVRPAAAGTSQRLPLSLTIAEWLLRRYFHPRRPVGVELRTVAADLDPAGCAALGAALRAPRRWALLVMGDGSACRGEKSPGYADPRAEPFDTAVAGALADAAPDALLALDPALADELLAAGRAPWQVLAGAATAAGDATTWRGDLLAHEAPYGVAYFVATWRPA
jgi:hypothetical protein